MTPLTNARHEAFCLEYMMDRDATEAYYRAGYKPSNRKAAQASASRLLSNVKSGVPDRIAELAAEFGARCGFEIEDVFKRLQSIVEADPTALTKIVRGACRYCYGTKHAHQWRTEREFKEAVVDYNQLSLPMKAAAIRPTNAGGYGYRSTLTANPNCPECDGLGIARAHFADTDSIPAASRVLFAGVEQTQHGIKIQTHDQFSALKELAKHLGFYSKDNERKVGLSDEMAKFLEDINRGGSKANLTSKRRANAKGDKPDA